MTAAVEASVPDGICLGPAAGRVEFLRGLRELLCTLEDHPEIGVPMAMQVIVYPLGSPSLRMATVNEMARHLRTAAVWETAPYLHVSRMFGPIEYGFRAGRAEDRDGHACTAPGGRPPVLQDALQDGLAGPCVHCQGSGLLRPGDGSLIDCRWCDGTGMAVDPDHEDATVVMAAVPVQRVLAAAPEQLRADCFMCDGTGRMLGALDVPLEHPCSICSGRGSYPEEGPRHWTDPGTGTAYQLWRPYRSGWREQSDGARIAWHWVWTGRRAVDGTPWMRPVGTMDDAAKRREWLLSEVIANEGPLR